MDEIFIGEKKYISSKQAAKATGYAKDYIGQLCREGRVPARLVGRSWYVLEAAIHDHRFGDQKKEEETRTVSPASIFSPTWESPRYEASAAAALPVVDHPQEMKDDQGGAPDVSQHLQDSWKAWFDRVADIEPIVFPSPPEKVEEEERRELEEEGKEVNIPFHAVYRQPPEELLPRHSMVRPSSDFEGTQTQRGEGGRGVRIIQISGALLAALAATLAVLGTGYFDKYIISDSQVSVIAGVIFYNK